jgi:glycosyltransferase involved in cell wall biosynthesis
MKKKSQDIGILTFPISNSGIIPLSNLINIMFANSNKTYLITGNEGYERFKNDDKVFRCYGVKHTSGSGIISRVIKYYITQLKIAYLLWKLNRDIDTWLFFIGADSLLLPMLVAKLSKKNVVFIRAGSTLESLSATQDKSFVKTVSWITRINLYLSDRIVVYSSRFIEHWNLEKHEDKIMVLSEHIININHFKITKKTDERQKIIGYVGRISGEKGVFNFVKAIPLIQEYDFCDFIFIGDGNLRSEITACIVANNVSDKVKLTGWIPHDQLPDYLNKLKLLVLPSYTEGLPNVMLEAMACGTPIVTTNNGDKLDWIHNKTGIVVDYEKLK